MKRKLSIVAFLLVVTLGGLALSRFSVTALDEPGRIETAVAKSSKRLLIRRAARSASQPPPRTQATLEQGDKLYGADCAMCHGMDGHTPTETGRWMYPRAADLRSLAVQSYSDQELFWIIKNGIKFSGMPAFGRVESDEHIWSLVHYVRALEKDSALPR